MPVWIEFGRRDDHVRRASAGGQASKDMSKVIQTEEEKQRHDAEGVAWATVEVDQQRAQEREG